MLLPAVAGVLVHIAVDVGVVIVAGAGRPPGIGVAGIGIGGRATADVRITLGSGGRRARAVVGAAARGRPGCGVACRALPGVGVVVAGARDFARTARRTVHGAIVAARSVAGVGVVLAPGVVTARRAGAIIVVIAAGGGAGDAAAGVPRTRTRVGRAAPVPVDVGGRRRAARVSAPVGGMIVGAAPVRLSPRRGGEAEREPIGEAHVRVVDRRRRDAVGVWRRVPDAADPRRIRIARPVDDGAVRRDHGAEVAWRIADVYDRRRGFVDAHIGHIVQRRRRWNCVDHIRHHAGDDPRTADLRGLEPHAGGDRVVARRAHLDQRRRRVDDVIQRRALDRRVLRGPVEVRREVRTILQRNGCRLRNGVSNQRFLRLRRAGHRRQHRARQRRRRDLREIRRQRVAGDKGPRPPHPRRLEPAASEQRVVIVAGGLDEHVAGGVGRPEQVGAHDRHEIGLALEYDQLAGHVADENSGHTVEERGFRIRLGTTVEHVDDAGLDELLRGSVHAERQPDRL